MEFDIEKNKVVGIIDHRLKGDCVKIRPIGFINSKKCCELFTDSEILELFPNSGHVFEPGFFLNYSWKIGELIEFKVKEIEIPKEDGDLYRMFTDNNNKPKPYGFRVFNVRNLIVNQSSIDLSQIILENGDENYLSSFFCICKDRIYGKLKSQNGKIVTEGHSVRSWDKAKCSYFEYLHYRYLLQEPGVNENLFDTMDENDLFTWFKKKLNELNINKRALDFLNQNIRWQDGFSEVLKDPTEEKLRLERIRFERIVNSITQFELSITDIKELIKTSEKLERIFIASIERHKTELRSEYTEEIEKLEAQKELEKQKLEQSLSKISVDIAHKKNELASLDEEISTKKSHIEHIAANKDRILSDFSIIQEVLGGKSEHRKSIENTEDSFVIEAIMPSEGVNQIIQKDIFISRLKYHLNRRQRDISKAAKMLAGIATFKGIFANDVNCLLALIEATGNAKYIIQQVEPDWLHFKDLWVNGLEAIWKSSHENPDILHFLVLEDINLASPECFMRPLLDCMNGIRKRIPYALNEYPDNLKIIATKISSDEPRIGLPLYQKTFGNWAAYGFAEPLNNTNGQHHSFVDGFITSNTFIAFKSDEPLEQFAEKFVNEYKELFDN